MRNFSDQQVGQTAQRATDLGVEALSAGVGANLRRQASQEPFEGLRPVALQEEEVLELVYDPLDDLPLSRRPQPSGGVPRSLGVVLGGRGHQSPVLQEPVALPPNRGKALVGQISRVAVAVDEDLADGPLAERRWALLERAQDAALVPPKHANYPAVEDAIWVGIREALLGNKSVEKALEDTEAAARRAAEGA